MRAGRSPAEIVGDIRSRGLLEAPDAAALGRLQAAEADPALLRWLAAAEVRNLVVSQESAAQARDTAARLRDQKESDRQFLLARLSPEPAAATDPVQLLSASAGAAPGNAPTPVALSPTAGSAFATVFDRLRRRPRPRRDGEKTDVDRLLVRG